MNKGKFYYQKEDYYTQIFLCQMIHFVSHVQYKRHTIVRLKRLTALRQYYTRLTIYIYYIKTIQSNNDTVFIDKTNLSMTYVISIDLIHFMSENIYRLCLSLHDILSTF